MLSLGIWLAVLLGGLAVTAWVIARTARAVGSKRGRWSVGWLVVMIMLALGLVITFIESARTAPPAADPDQPAYLDDGVPPQDNPAADLIVPLFLLALQLGIAFEVNRRAFRLSPGRAMAPLGALVGMQLGLAALALLVLRPYVSESFQMPTQGMSPALEPGDRFFVNKVVDPQRWDIAAYRLRGNGEDLVFCQRIVGLPGDRLRFDDGAVWVNDQRLTPPPEVKTVYSAVPPRVRSRYQDGQTIELKADEYFLVGDNSDISLDSRLRGPTNASDIVGVADLRYWPLGRITILR